LDIHRVDELVEVQIVRRRGLAKALVDDLLNVFDVGFGVLIDVARAARELVPRTDVTLALARWRLRAEILKGRR
jgi:hypothetical protein